MKEIEKKTASTSFLSHMRKIKKKKLKVKRTFQMMKIESKGEKKNSNIREIMCFGKELKGSIYSAQ